jgi:hypothetical protein
MHPLQAMEVTFGLHPCNINGAKKSDRAVVIDTTLPQARTAVRYSIARLIDVRAAAAFGPLANIFTGLNYKLTERLETITEEAVIGDRPRAIIATGPGASVVRTIDGGATFQKVQSLRPAKVYATIGAGPRPRIPHLGALLEEAVYGGPIPAEKGIPRAIADPERLLENYHVQADSFEPYISLDELGQTLIRRFGVFYDESPPRSAEEFKAAVLGEGSSRDPYRSYIAQTLSEVSKRGTENRLIKNEISGAQGPALLFGGRLQAAKGGRREALLTSLIQLRQSISVTTSQLAQAYDRLGIDARANNIYSEKERGRAGYPQAEDKVRSAALESRQQMEALVLYRLMVEEAFYSARKPRVGRAAQAVNKVGSVELRLSIKLYVLERGDTSADM